MKYTTLLILVLNHAESCIRTESSAKPASPTAPCCSVDIADTNSSGRFLFNPALTSCPTAAVFICSIQEDGSTAATRITINESKQVAEGSGGTNSMVMLTCDLSTQQWSYETTTNVDTIRCDA